MKVKDLLQVLQTCDPEAEVICQEDAEGNGYAPLAGADNEAIYVPASIYCGQVYSTDWTAEDADMDEKDWKKILKKKRCVVLYPIS
jgi:hypothetical protein